MKLNKIEVKALHDVLEQLEVPVANSLLNVISISSTKQGIKLFKDIVQDEGYVTTIPEDNIPVLNHRVITYFINKLRKAYEDN